MLSHYYETMIHPKRVVILGAHGFVSSHLKDLLTCSGVPMRLVSSREADLTQSESVACLANIFHNDDTVVMTSALTPEKGKDYSITMANLRMAETLCAALEISCPAHLIYLSSDAIYDAQKIPLDEDSSREPIDLYALMHTAREMMLENLAKKLSLPLCILRPTSLYGCGDTHKNYGPNRFIASALKDQKIVLFGRGEERRNHLYIKDAVQLIWLVCGYRSEGVLNLVADRSWSFLQIAQLIKDFLSFSVEFDFQKRTLPIIHKPYKPTQVFRFLYNLGRPITPVVHRPFHISALRRAFPQFKFTPIRNGLSETIRDHMSSTLEGDATRSTPLP